MVNLSLQDAARTAVITACLEAHSEQENFIAGDVNGPPFKMCWTGVNKSDALCIETNTDWDMAVTALKARKSRSTSVTVEFDVDQMHPWKARKRVSSSSTIAVDDDLTDSSLELGAGTKVPRLDLFSEDDHLHGRMILKLQKKYPCNEHQGEHGQPGHCFVDTTGKHMGLNHRKFAIWASAIVAGDCTVHAPPNSVEFDGLRDGRLTTVKPRGRTHIPAAETSSANNLQSLLMAATVSVLQNSLSGNQVTPPQRNQVPVPETPERPRTRTNIPSSPISPIPSSLGELHTFLADLKQSRGLDFTSAEYLFEQKEFTPDIIPSVRVATLCELTGAPEGRVLKMVDFAKSWNARLLKKKDKAFRTLAT
ncbi:hypothetical protein BDP27DRAFT_1262192 [Rhodocollybia butyracea]|uniref:Uncharacterized protein n=1 Tax=Rhodocollybia butyracea TaxID=206335 RepID=A0A9P5UAE2_9AGAR|nr:hypothetical protein BDP27DRAFT_1262192 [Rhodocollybia butyracea]